VRWKIRAFEAHLPKTESNVDTTRTSHRKESNQAPVAERLAVSSCQAHALVNFDTRDGIRKMQTEVYVYLLPHWDDSSSLACSPINIPAESVIQTMTQPSNMAGAESQARLAAIVNSSDDAIIGKTLEGVITSWNPGAEKIFGYAAAEAVGQPMLMLFPPERMHEEPEILAKIGRGESVAHFETVRVRKDGRRIDVSVTLSPIADARGKIIGASKIARDITERKRAEEALLRLAAIVSASNDAIISKTLEGLITNWNPGAERMFGYSAAEAIGQPLLLLFPPDRVDEEKDILVRLKRGEKVENYETVRLHKDGRRIEVSVSVSPIIESTGKILGAMKIVGTSKIMRDITPLKQAEAALRESELKFRQIAAAINEVFWITTPQLDEMLYVSPAYETIWGRTCESLYQSPKGWIEAIHPDDRDNVHRVAATKRKHGDFDVIYRIVRPDGSMRWIHDRGFPVRDAAGKIYRIAGVAEDITEQRQADESLRLLGSAIEQSKESIVLTDAQLDLPGPKILFVNPAFTEMTGYAAGEVIGKTPRILQGPRTDRAVLERLRKNLARGESFTGETVNYRKDGKEFILEWQIAPIRDAKGTITHFVALQRDITERRKLEEQFRQAQKMEGIGQMAGGVAHDFNNILAVIQMQSELLKSSGNLSTDQTAFADEIGNTVQRAAALTRQLLLFSRREVFQPRDLDLSESITSTAKMLQRTLGEHVQMQLKLAAQPMFIQMDQVLMNLCVNARDAMPNGGQLIIETSGVEFDGFAASQSSEMRAGSFVCLSVSDSGCGIPPEILPKIFEPFFTTKDVGKGTGLGLATVFGIAQQHQGWINVYSEVNHGTTFRMYLPRLSRNGKQASATPAPADLRGGHETILLAEDDPALRVSVRKALVQLGYRILEAPTGIKALEVWKENRSEIRLLLTDLVMPDGMSGIDLAQQILQENSKTKVIYMSGYSAEVAGKDFPLKEGVNFLTKPFQAAKLAQIIRIALDA
jgi:PAS domain S-box-containing protein